MDGQNGPVRVSSDIDSLKAENASLFAQVQTLLGSNGCLLQEVDELKTLVRALEHQVEALQAHRLGEDTSSEHPGTGQASLLCARRCHSQPDSKKHSETNKPALDLDWVCEAVGTPTTQDATLGSTYLSRLRHAECASKLRTATFQTVREGARRHNLGMSVSVLEQLMEGHEQAATVTSSTAQGSSGAPLPLPPRGQPYSGHVRRGVYISEKMWVAMGRPSEESAMRDIDAVVDRNPALRSSFNGFMKLYIVGQDPSPVMIRSVIYNKDKPSQLASFWLYPILFREESGLLHLACITCMDPSPPGSRMCYEGIMRDHMLVKYTPAMVCMCDGEGCIITQNAASFNAIGVHGYYHREPGAARFNYLQELFVAAPHQRDEMQAVTASGASWSGVVEVMSPGLRKWLERDDDERIWHSVHVSRLQDPVMLTPVYSVAEVDVSDRMKARLALERLQAQQQALLSQILPPQVIDKLLAVEEEERAAAAGASTTLSATSSGTAGPGSSHMWGQLAKGALRVVDSNGEETLLDLLGDDDDDDDSSATTLPDTPAPLMESGLEPSEVDEQQQRQGQQASLGHSGRGGRRDVASAVKEAQDGEADGEVTVGQAEVGGGGEDHQRIHGAGAADVSSFPAEEEEEKEDGGVAGGTAHLLSSSSSSLSDGIGLSQRDVMSLATYHEQVTILFADIKGFTTLSSLLQPAQVMVFLNALYSAFDALLEQYGVYKVETIGDCYMVAGGLFACEGKDGHKLLGGCDPDHARKVLGFAKAMQSTAAQLRNPLGEPVEMRIGMHCGSVMSGVVGRKMPRFCLFGDTVNTASRMESTGAPGKIHASEAVRDALPHEPWEATGGVEAKGKGVLTTYFWGATACRTLAWPALHKLLAHCKDRGGGGSNGGGGSGGQSRNSTPRHHHHHHGLLPGSSSSSSPFLRALLQSSVKPWCLAPEAPGVHSPLAAAPGSGSMGPFAACSNAASCGAAGRPQVATLERNMSMPSSLM